MQDEQMIGNETEAAASDTQQASEPYVGMWQRLISRTNWDKGRIICEWRDALVANGASASEYSDEAWGGLVGSVSSQHVGRLRRVYRRFGETHDNYQGLYWSHFCAAIDWNDAEMWLEGGVQNGWSVAHMRDERCQAVGAIDPPPMEGDLADAIPWDEDGLPAELDADPSLSPSVAEVQDTAAEADRDVGRSEASSRKGSEAPATAASSQPEAVAVEMQLNSARPLEDLPPLPDDLAEAFESFKLALLKHKLSGWAEVACEDLLQSLDALKQLAVAPSGDEQR
ncbi:MAG: hypothetical protein ACC645_00675 [Pirellulales bacterium]